MKKKTLITLLLLTTILGVATYLWLRPDPIPVVVAVVDRGLVRATVANTRAGTVKACRRAGLAKLPVKEGDSVTAGQVLLELWNDDLSAELLLARRDAVAAQSRAEEACVRSDVARREAERLTRLYERGLASEEESDRAVGDARALAAACSAARAAARVNEAKVDVAVAKLERTVLRAPFDGVIAEINGEVGEYVTPSPVGIATPPAVDLIDESCLYISAPIDEIDAPAVAPGQPARITLDAFPAQAFAAVVRRVAPYVLDVEKQARTVEIEAVITDRGDDRLLPGYSADVEVLLDERDAVLRVPSQVLIDGRRVLVSLTGEGKREAKRLYRLTEKSIATILERIMNEDEQ